jgi:hypothetical protein
MKARICVHGAGKDFIHDESGCAGRETNCPEVVALRGAVVRVEKVEEVAIAVVEHAALNLAEADVIPIRVRIAGALTVDANWAGITCAGCAPRHTSHVVGPGVRPRNLDVEATGMLNMFCSAPRAPLQLHEPLSSGGPGGGGGAGPRGPGGGRWKATPGTGAGANGFPKKMLAALWPLAPLTKGQRI